MTTTTTTKPAYPATVYLIDGTYFAIVRVPSGFDVVASCPAHGEPAEILRKLHKQCVPSQASCVNFFDGRTQPPAGVYAAIDALCELPQ